MKTTIATESGNYVIAQPVGGAVMVSIHNKPANVTQVTYLTPDQCGALIFGLEQALEAMEQREKSAAMYAKKYEAKGLTVRERFESECG